jgi:hypothetical protein
MLPSQHWRWVTKGVLRGIVSKHSHHHYYRVSSHRRYGGDLCHCRGCGSWQREMWQIITQGLKAYFHLLFSDVLTL